MLPDLPLLRIILLLLFSQDITLETDSDNSRIEYIVYESISINVDYILSREFIELINKCRDDLRKKLLSLKINQNKSSDSNENLE